ncbi:WxcM-like domain-containing protein [Sphingorhabdus sp.]|uniref:WxcM-like domain-containing protein n=1 Tax=Sphingorhabdus sp. TaxID=1902408 RepID=UPI0035B1F875
MILEKAKIGSDCNICSHCFIENDVVIGDRVTVKNGVHLWDGLRLGDDVFVGPHVSFTNDIFPRSKHLPDVFQKTEVKCGASIGANATILPGVIIGKHAMIGAGSVVTRSVPDHAIVVGNPATIIGYTNIQHQSTSVGHSLNDFILEEVISTDVSGVTLHRLKSAADMRGSLTVGEFQRDIPFEVKRFFFVHNVPSKEVRGEHAHRKCAQFLICVRGSCTAIVDDGKVRQEFLLSQCDIGLYMPPMTWGTQYRYSSNAMLLVFASEYYDPADYIREYDSFLAETASISSV